MFHVPTVMIIGAGAGVDLDMPTGDTLCYEIANRVNIFFDQGEKIRGNDETLDAMRRLARVKNSDVNRLAAAGRQIAKGIYYSGSIDSYLHTHNDNDNIKLCGKLGIIQTIVEFEKNSKLFVDTAKHPLRFRDEDGVRDSWLRQFMLLLQDGIIARGNIKDVFKNLIIINFNYDRCIEQFLYRMVQDLFLIGDDSAAELMTKLKLYHPYGTVAALPWQRQTDSLEFGGSPHGENTFEELIDNIRTFNEEVSEGDELRVLREVFSVSKRFIFLGFHFHKQNLELITPRAMKGEIEVFATALNRSASDVEEIKAGMTRVFGREVTYSRHQYYEMKMNCRDLFTNFGTRFASAP